MPISRTPPKNGKQTTVKSEALLKERKRHMEKRLVIAFPVENRNYSRTYFCEKRASEDFAIGGMSVT